MRVFDSPLSSTLDLIFINYQNIGFAIFSVIGFMSKDLNQDIDKVVDQGINTIIEI